VAFDCANPHELAGDGGPRGWSYDILDWPEWLARAVQVGHCGRIDTLRCHYLATARTADRQRVRLRCAERPERPEPAKPPGSLSCLGDRPPSFPSSLRTSQATFSSARRR